jgi:hypothetical protein
MADVLMKFTGRDDPVLSRPFTVIDPQGAAWGVASDKVSFVAVKGCNTFSRYQGPASSLTVVLGLLKVAAADSIDVIAAEVSERIPEDAAIVSVLGVSVNPGRLKDILLSSPEHVEVWDCSAKLGVPSLAFFGKDWKAFLMGHENVEDEVPVLDLADDQHSLFALAMSL